MFKFRVIFKQVFLKNIKSPAYLIMILMPIVMIGITLGVSRLMNHSKDPVRIAVLASQPTEQAELQQLKGNTYQINQQITTQEQATKALQKEQIDGYLVLSEEKGQTVSRYYQRKDSPSFDASILENQLNQIHLVALAQQAGVAPEQIHNLMTPTVIAPVTVNYQNGHQEISRENTKEVSQIISIGITVLMFIFIVNYAGMIAQEIATEKGSRIMEIILSSVSIETQFFAKIAAILALLVTQMVVYILVGIIGFQILKQYLPLAELLPVIRRALVAPAMWYAGLFLIIGVLLYTVLAAMLGAVVSRMDQVQQAISPLILLGTLSYLGGFLLASQPGMPVLRVVSYVPLFSQIMLPVRLANGDVGTLGASMGLLVAMVTLIGLTYFALLIYRMNILVYSDKGIFKALFATYQQHKEWHQ
ncbi:ABC transporter permease [Latilactobacillus fragifolii]|uniref:ABC transporter permease n=1 Tax=Latilactobacillus fragifolii TaxID=2814244 RepID=UPI001ABB8DB9|nr:ABC transporter permease [Latilactobacillus fragifolii]